jgi:hypothetical protein
LKLLHRRKPRWFLRVTKRKHMPVSSSDRYCFQPTTTML